MHGHLNINKETKLFILFEQPPQHMQPNPALLVSFRKFLMHP